MKQRTVRLAALLACAMGCGGTVIGPAPSDGGQDSNVDTSVGPPDGHRFEAEAPDATEEFPTTDALEELPQVDSPDELSPIDSSSDAGTCTPPATVAITPVLHVNPPSSDCTPAMIERILMACFDDVDPDASASGCSSLIAMPAYATCFQDCMDTDSVTGANVDTASAAWGGIIFIADHGSGQFGFYNLGGCVAALDPSTAGQRCATDLEANIECLVTACNACSVPTTADDAELMDYDACEGAAEPGACSAYEAAATTDCAADEADGGPASACFAAVATLAMEGASQAASLRALNVLYGSVCAPALVDGG